MSRTMIAFALCLGVTSAACVSEEVEPDQLGEASSALVRGDSLHQPRIDTNDLVVSAVQYGLSWSARAESNAWNWSWGSGRSGFTAGEFNWYGNYGYCTSYSWGNRCNSSRDTWFITPGWGSNFQYYWGQPNPAGWSTFGQHPYWCPNQTVGDGNSVNNTWHGWSTSNHCGGTP